MTNSDPSCVRCLWGMCVAIVAVLCGLLLAPSRSSAQGLSGITGTVTDQSGAVVPDAKVTATNTATNVMRSAVTTSAGVYTIVDVNPGTYTIKVEKAGFETAVLATVDVYVSQTATANATLTPGAVAQTIEVQGAAITIQTEDADINTTINNEIVHEAPTLIGGGPGNVGPRDMQIDDFIFLSPGASGGEFEHRLDGGIGYQNEVMFNGVVAVQSETQGYQSNINPPFELVNEINVISSNLDAKYGLAQGVASYRFSSGTNQLHGDAFEANRNTAFNAAGADPTNSSYSVVGTAPNQQLDFDKAAVPPIHQNSFGFSVGGPVWLPKIYNGKNKTFFYTSVDWFKQNALGGGTLTVPTQAMVGGNFSVLCATGFNAAGVCNDTQVNPVTGATVVAHQLYVPQNFTGTAVPAGCTAPAPGSPWPGDVIPSACFNAASASLFSAIPKISGNALSNNFPSQYGIAPIRQTNGGFTIDQNLGQTQVFHVAWWEDRYSTIGINEGFAPNSPLIGGEIDPRRGTGFFLTYSKTFSSDLVMTAGFGWMGELNFEYNLGPAYSFTGVAGGTVLPGIQFHQNAGDAFNPSTWGLVSSSGGGETFSINRKLGLSFDNNWLWTHGRHTMNFGWEVRRSYQDDHECQQCAGLFNFDAAETADPTFDLGETGDAFASFLLGDVDSGFRRFVAENRLRNLYFAPYFQDNIKLTPRLTFNAGLRWDIMRPFLENDNNVTFFDPTEPNPGAVDPATGQDLLGASTRLGFCSACAGYRRANIHWHDLSPRVGFAYQLNSRTVLLGGYAINFLDQGPYEYGNNKISVDYGSLSNGLISYTSHGNNIPGLGFWGNGTNDTIQMAVPAAVPISPTLFNGVSVGLYQFSKNPGPNSYVQMWNFGVQRELSNNILISASYVGNRGVHLLSMLNPINQTNPVNLSKFCPNGVPSDPTCLMSPASPNNAWTSAPSQAALASVGFASAPVTCGANTHNPGLSGTYYTPYVNFLCDWGNSIGLQQALLPHPMFAPSESAGGLTNQFNMAGSSFYNALQVQAQKRWSNGLTFLINYTLSRDMANTDSGFSSFNYGALNGYNQASEWTVASPDQTHLLNISGVYELPIGPGKQFLNHGGIVMKNILGGWQLSGVLTYASGLPVNNGGNGSQDAGEAVLSNTDPYLNGFNRADYNSSIPLNVNWNNYFKSLNLSGSATQPAFNTAAFSDPGFTGGNEPRLVSALRGPWILNENAALAKHFYMGERVSMELRMEYFNLLNRVQVCGPNLGVDNGPMFGVVNAGGFTVNGSNIVISQACQANTARQGEAYLRLNF
jgi:Carboxypeptidase regulatory-like domain/TonB dependent receptor